MPHVVFRHFGVVLNRQIAMVVATPLVGEASQVRIGPRHNGWVPRFASSAHAEERSREGIVDRPLKSRPFASQSHGVEVAAADPASAPLFENERANGFT